MLVEQFAQRMGTVWRWQLTGAGGADSLRGKGKKVAMLNLGFDAEGVSRLGFTTSLLRFCWILSISQSSNPICTCHSESMR